MSGIGKWRKDGQETVPNRIVVAILREGEKPLTKGEVLRKHGISEQAFHRDTNGYIEIFNGKLRYECLNKELFHSTVEVRR